MAPWSTQHFPLRFLKSVLRTPGDLVVNPPYSRWAFLWLLTDGGVRGKKALLLIILKI